MSELGKSFPINVDKITDKLDDKISKIPEIFIVGYELTPTSETAFTGTSDKTYAEISEAWESGKILIADVRTPVIGAHLQLTSVGISGEGSPIQFAGLFIYSGVTPMYLIHTSDDRINAIMGRGN